MRHKCRLDNLLVARGLVESRAKAQALIMAGDILVGGKAVTKAGTPVDEEAVVTVVEPPPFVGRGGIKLEHALNEFGINVAGKMAADIGASTGGFTDCLLKRGASRVYAVDVGYGQLDYRLRRDSRVEVLEMVLLKPQFEARRSEVGKGGVIKEPAVQARVLGRFINWLAGHGFRLNGLVASPIRGASGNREFLVWLKPLRL